MLVLNRRPGHAILIQGQIRIIVLSCDHRGARIGIEAPTSVGIVREEIALRVADENGRATNPAAAKASLNSGADQPDV